MCSQVDYNSLIYPFINPSIHYPSILTNIFQILIVAQALYYGYNKNNSISDNKTCHPFIKKYTPGEVREISDYCIVCFKCYGRDENMLL